MNFSNNGFVFAFNETLEDMYTGAIEQKVNEALEKFRATPETLNWSAVDYSKL